jgi:hypothetical protein
VIRFCERAAYIDGQSGKVLADFSVRYRWRHELLILDLATTPGQAAEASSDRSQAANPTLVDLGSGERVKIRYVCSADLLAMRAWTANWERMLPYLAANESLVPKALPSQILKFAARRHQLNVIEREFARIDLMLVRTAVFALLHRGKLDAPSLRSEPLSPYTSFVATVR